MKRLLLLSFIWGWSFLFIKVSVEGLTPPTVAWARVTLGAVALVIVARPTARELWRGGLVRHYLVVALIANALPFTLLAWSEERITSALTAVLNASTPLFTAVIAALYLHDRLSRRQVAGLLLGFAGVAIAAGFGTGDLAGASITGSLAAVAAGACYGAAFVYMRKHLIDVAPTTAAAGQLLAASALLLPFAVGTSVSHGVSLTPARVASILLLGVIGTGLAYVLNYRIIRDLGATRASLVTYLIPVVAVVVGIVVLDEPFQWRLIAGGVVIALGVALVHGRAGILGRLFAVTTLLALLVGCSGGSSANAACTPARAEAVDADAHHVLPGAPEPSFPTNPPTSGPHSPGAAPTPVLDQPLLGTRQVGILESGSVLVQYRDLDPADIDQLRSIASANTIVAPNPSLADPVVATAWLYKQSCSRVDLPTLRGFVADHAGRGPGQGK